MEGSCGDQLSLVLNWCHANCFQCDLGEGAELPQLTLNQLETMVLSLNSILCDRIRLHENWSLFLLLTSHGKTWEILESF